MPKAIIGCVVKLFGSCDARKRKKIRDEKKKKPFGEFSKKFGLTFPFPLGRYFIYSSIERRSKKA